MPDRLREHAPIAPTKRVGAPSDIGYFFPGEAARVLDLGHIDYHQLRRIYVLCRRQAGLPVPNGWARYSLRDLACVSAVIDLCGGRPALAPGRRLQLKAVEDACSALRSLGFSDPLLQVPLVREGRRVYALLEQGTLDPTTGQLVLRDTFSTVATWLAAAAIQDADLRAALSTERKAGVARAKPRIAGRAPVS